MRKAILLVIIIPLFLSVLNCASVNETQKSDKFPEIKQARFKEEADKELSHLFKVNPVLTEELRKLPELKRGLDEKGLLALNRIVKFYTQSSNSEEVKQIFDRILSIGKKERRKFSAPLQALFWLAEENEIPLGENLLKIHSKEKYRGFNKNLGEDEEVITFVYNIWRYDTDKWKDTNEIIDRLNSPHLFDLFFRDNIAYDFDKSAMKRSDRKYYENWGSYLQSAKVTIKKRKGTCDDAANLADEVLKKTGYNVKPLQVKFGKPSFTGSNRHWVAVLKEGGLFYKIADDAYVKEGIVGPFKSIKEIGEKVAESLGTYMQDYSLSQVPIR
ncbi:MAG: transglutaminase-like domain-containing protein [Thermodesulfobacteriota bacterium]|nr:transglutaminase-like domain-containing protein [Thermodesulfobacteriota bacterium]